MSKLLSLIVSVVMLTGLWSCNSQEEYGRDFNLKARDIQLIVGEAGEVEFIYGSGNYKVESQDEQIATGVVKEVDQGESGCRLVVTSVSAGKTVLTVSNGFDDIDVEVSVVDPYMAFCCGGMGYAIGTDVGYDTSDAMEEIKKDFPFLWNSLFMLVKDKPGTIFLFASKEDAKKQRPYQSKGTYKLEKTGNKSYLIINLEDHTYRFVISGDAEGTERFYSYFDQEWLQSRSDVVETLPEGLPRVTLAEDVTDLLREKFGDVIHSAERHFDVDILEDGFYRLPVQE